jgi:hypothetical protein
MASSFVGGRRGSKNRRSESISLPARYPTTKSAPSVAETTNNNTSVGAIRAQRMPDHFDLAPADDVPTGESSAVCMLVILTTGGEFRSAHSEAHT